MTHEDLPAFTAELTLTAELFGAQLSKARIMAYFQALEDQDWEAVRMGFHLCRRASRFMPMPADLLEQIRGPVEERAAAAFQAVWDRLVRGRDVHVSALASETVQNMGGASVFTEAQVGSGSILYGQFTKLYMVLAARHRREATIAALEAHEAPALEESTHGG